jgi:hypothetical protein
VPTSCYRGVLEVEEWAPLDPRGGHHQKYHAPDVGIVKIDASGDVNPEVLQLVEHRVVCPSELAKVRDAALKLDKHGYKTRPDVYARTSPARQTLQGPHCKP